MYSSLKRHNSPAIWRGNRIISENRLTSWRSENRLTSWRNFPRSRFPVQQFAHASIRFNNVFKSPFFQTKSFTHAFSLQLFPHSSLSLRRYCSSNKNDDDNGEEGEEEGNNSSKPSEEEKKQEVKDTEATGEEVESAELVEDEKVPDNKLVVLGEPTTLIKAQRQLPTPETVPVIPLWKRPIFPSHAIRIPLRLDVLEEIQRYTKNVSSLVGIFMVKSAEEESNAKIKGVEDLHSVGVLATVTAIAMTPVPGIIVHAAYRVKIKEQAEVEQTNVVFAKIERVETKPADFDDLEVKALCRELYHTISLFDKIEHIQQQTKEQLHRLRLSNHLTVGELADSAIAVTTNSHALQEALEDLDDKSRLTRAIIALRAELKVAHMQHEAQAQLEQTVQKQHRKFVLNEQLKAIRKELGEKDDKTLLVQKFQDRIKDKKVPEAASKVIEEEIAKLQTLEAHSSEFNVTRNYLDWLTILPWDTYSPENLDLAHAEKVLDEDHYGLKDVKDRILEFIAVGKLRNGISGKILCFVGPPGVGKTSIGKSIAASVNRKFYRFSVGGMSDVAEIKGHRRTYVGAMPGKLLQALKSLQTANPMILIDEIDKLGRHSYHGDPAAALLEVLDPAQNEHFLDHYLDVAFDLSKVLFVCTANVTDTIPAPLLDRMEVIQLSGYILEEKLNIAKKYLLPAAIKDSGLKKEHFHITDSVLRQLITNYCREAGVRSLQKQIEKICRKVAIKVVRGEKLPLNIHISNLTEYVGQPLFTSDRIYQTPQPGVVMGLAWTAMGGSALYVEAVVDRLGNKPGLKVTGRLGETMKESTDIAYTVAKNLIEQVSVGNRFFETSSLHLHFPEGATPKDGPSAGVTITTSLLSLALNKPVIKNLGMTGELTLTGKVLPVGGIKEKIIAAKRSRVEIVIIPKENKKDWDELEQHVKDGITIHFADWYKDVYSIAFGPEPEKEKASSAAAQTRKPRKVKKAKPAKKKPLSRKKTSQATPTSTPKQPKIKRLPLIEEDELTTLDDPANT